MKNVGEMPSKDVIMDFVAYLLSIGERKEALAAMQVRNFYFLHVKQL